MKIPLTCCIVALLVTSSLFGMESMPRSETGETLRRLELLRYPKIQFHEKPLNEVCLFLTQESTKLAPDKKGVKIVLDSDLSKESQKYLITLNPMDYIPLSFLLEDLAFEYKLKYSIADDTITFHKR